MLQTTKLIIFAFICFGYTTFSHAASPNEISGKKIMQTVYDQNETHKTQESYIQLSIFDDNNDKKVRYFRSKKKITPEKVRILLKFYRPNSIKGTGLLTVKSRLQQDISQWIYFPAIRQVKKLSANEKNESFMGSDFTYDDIAGRKLNQDNHTLVKQNKKHYFIRSMPVDEDSLYSKMDIVISKKLFIPLQIQFYDKKGDLLKTLRNKKITIDKNVPTVFLSIMKNNQSGGKTELTIEKNLYGVEISDSDVSYIGLQK